MATYNSPRLDPNNHLHKETIILSTDSGTEQTPTVTPRSFDGATTSQLTSPRANLLWDHGYDVAQSPIDPEDDRDREWKTFNVTDDDKINADREAIEKREKRLKIKQSVINAENPIEDEQPMPAPAKQDQQYLPDLLAFIGSTDMTQRPVDTQLHQFDDSCESLPDAGYESLLFDAPPPLPAKDPPPLTPTSEQHDDDDVRYDYELQGDFGDTLEPVITDASYSRTTTQDGQTNIGKNIGGIFKSLLDFDLQSYAIKADQTMSSQPVESADNTNKREPSVVDDIDEADISEDEEQKKIEEEFEAILHAFDLNFGQDTYVERFSGRRDKYGFILSPIGEAPSPTPSSLSGYSGISSASPDPFSVFRMSPAPRGGRLDLDLSSLGVNPADFEDNDRTVPIYQTVQAKKAIVVPDGYGWDSGDDLLSPTGSGEWDLSENGLSSPPVSASGINLTQFGSHLVGWKQPQAVIFEEPETIEDSEGTLDGDTNSEHGSDSTLEDLHRNKTEYVDNIIVHDESLNGESTELELLANVDEATLQNNQFEELRANQRTPIVDHLNKQSGLQRPESNQSFAVSDSCSETSGAVEAEDEYSESESEAEATEELRIIGEIDNTESDDDQNIHVTELLSPRTAILLSGGMYPVDSDSSYLTDDTDNDDGDDDDDDNHHHHHHHHHHDDNDVEEESDVPEIDPNMSSYGSGVLVTQYTSGDSDSDYSKATQLQEERAQTGALSDDGPCDHEEGQHSSNRIKSHTKVHSPLNFSFVPTLYEIPLSRESPLSPKEEEPRSPRVFGRYYEELEQEIIDEASLKSPVPNAGESEYHDTVPLSNSLNTNETRNFELDDSFQNIELKRTDNAGIVDINANQENESSDSDESTSEYTSHVCREAKYMESELPAEKLEGIHKHGNKSPESIDISQDFTSLVRTEAKGVDRVHTVNNKPDDKQTKIRHNSHVKIQVENLAKADSFKNKVKKGFVHQLSELFAQKDANTTVLRPTRKASLKKAHTVPDVIPPLSPQMVLPKENVIIMERSGDSPRIRESPLDTINSANESLGFEVTALKKVDAFDDDSVSDPSDKYDDDFESDSDENTNNIQLYEKQLEIAEDLEQTSKTIGHETDNETEISEQIEDTGDTDGSDDEELFRKIHACDQVLRENHQKPCEEIKSNRAASKEKMENNVKASSGPLEATISKRAKSYKDATHTENKPLNIKVHPLSQRRIDLEPVRVKSSDQNHRLSSNGEISRKRCGSAKHSKPLHSGKSNPPKTDLGGIFWSPKLADYKDPVPDRHEREGRTNTVQSSTQCTEHGSLLGVFANVDNRSRLPEELENSLHTTDSTKTAASNTLQKETGPATRIKSQRSERIITPRTELFKQALPLNSNNNNVSESTGADKNSNVPDISQDDVTEDAREVVEPTISEERLDAPMQRPLHMSLNDNRAEGTDRRLYNREPEYDDEYRVRYPASLSRRLYGPYCRVNDISDTDEQSEITPAGLSRNTGDTIAQDSSLSVNGSGDSAPILTSQVLPTCATDSNYSKSPQLPEEFKVFEYPDSDIRSSRFRNDRSIPLENSNGLSDLETDLSDKVVQNIDGRMLYTDVFDHSCYDVKIPLASPAQRDGSKPRSSPITYYTTTEAQRDSRCKYSLAKSNQHRAIGPEALNNDASSDREKIDFPMSQRPNCVTVEKSLPVTSRANGVNSDYVNEQNNVHADLTEGGPRPRTAVKNGFFHDNLGVCSPRENTATEDTHQHETMRNDTQLNETKQKQPCALSPGINGFSPGQTDSICQARMSEGPTFTYGNDSDKTLLGAAGGSPATVVLVQTAEYQHVLEDEKGNLTPWPYSDFETSHKVPVTLHRAKRQAKLIVKKAGMTDAPASMTVIQAAHHSTEMPENRMVEKYSSSAVMPEDRSVAQLMHTHGESVENVLFKDTNGNMLTEEELSAILPKIAESVNNMKDVDAEEILPGITQSIAKLQNGGNLVITTMTRKLDEAESDGESGRGSPETPVHPVLNVDDLENSQIYLVRDSRGELFYVEDITNESQESAYYSSMNNSGSASDVGAYSPTYQKISEVQQVGQSGIQGSTAQEILSAMYNDSDIQEITENEEEWSERTYEYERPRGRNPRQEYSKDSFRASYMVEEPDTLPRKATTVSQDKFESSYEISGGGMPWVYDGGMGQSYSQVTQATEEVDSASAISGVVGAPMTRTQEVLTVEAETEIYPLVPVPEPLPPVPLLVPPMVAQADTAQYSLVKVDVTPKSVEPVTRLPEQITAEEVDDKPIYKTVAHIQTREKQPPVKSEMAEPKKYRIVSSKATRTDEEEQETRMSLDEVDYKFTSENVEYKMSPSVQHSHAYVRNTTNLETPARYRTERTLELNNNLSEQKQHKTEIHVNDKKDDLLEEGSSFYSYDEQMRAKIDHADTSMKVVRGSYMIKNNLEEVDGTYDDNLNMFDGDFTLRKDNPLYQSDEDLYRKYEREKAEQARKQEHFRSRVNNDLSYETVDRFTKSKTVKREERPKQSLSEMLLSRLSTVDSTHIRQNIDVKHHSEDIYGDPRFMHVDGTNGAQGTYGSSSDFDTVGEKVDLLIKDGKAFITVKVTAERIVPLDMEFNVWRKNQAIVTRTIEVDLLATEHRRQLYYRVMEETPGASRGSRAGPNETILDSKQTLELFTKILGAADGEGDKEDITVKTRSGRTTRPFTSGMDLLY